MDGRVTVRDLDLAVDAGWAVDVLDRHLGGPMQALRGELIDVLGFEGLVAERDAERVGLLAYREGPDDCEILALVAAERGTGVGTGLLRALQERVTDRWQRIRVVTTNDNLDALRFYQRRGFRLVELRAGAVTRSRRTIKPSIGQLGAHGIPIRDELELVLLPVRNARSALAPESRTPE